MLKGRTEEIKILKEAVSSNKSELIILYGRRRIGKSTLLKSLVGANDLYFEGLQQVSEKEQISHFLDQFSEQTKIPRFHALTWRDAFQAITPHLLQKRLVVVFDEFPWMASEQVKLVSLLKYFWDRSWKDNAHLKLFLCGSIANYMLKHIIHSRALHNRKTLEMKLEALNCFDASQFFNKKMTQFEIAKLMMIFGGVPKYLEQVNPKLSLEANLDKLCFHKNGFFVKEFETIFKEQFRVTKYYETIVRLLARTSLSTEEISEKAKIPSGGGLGSYLKNLEGADFVKKKTSLALGAGTKEKTARFQLWDEWLKFYFMYIEPHMDSILLNTKAGMYESVCGKTIDTYFGLAFERLCYKNIVTLLEHLNIPLHQVKSYGPYFKQGSRRKVKGSAKVKDGLQIDLLLRCSGKKLVLFEFKFTTAPVGVSVIDEVEQKINLLKSSKDTRIEKVLVSASGATSDLVREDYFNSILDISTLF